VNFKDSKDFMPRGGARIGAGRKRKRPLIFPVIPGKSKGQHQVSMTPPQDLSKDEQAIWERYIGLAIERRTLITATLPAFRLLCELEAERQAVKRTIDAEGRTWLTEDGESKIHPLKTDYARLSKQVEALLKAFTLCPFGKPIIMQSVGSKSEQRQGATRSQFFGR